MDISIDSIFFALSCYNKYMKNIVNKKRIGIDARFYGTKNKGLGRYTKEIVDRITKFGPMNEYVIFLRRENFDEFTTDNPRVRKVLADIRWYSFAEQFRFPWQIYREKLDLMHFPHFNVPLLYRKKFMVTIHDLILTKHPTQRASTLSPWLYWIKNLAYRLAIRSAAKRAARILTISNYIKQEIEKLFGAGAKTKVIYEGVSDDLKSVVGQDDKKVIFGYNIDKPYLLYVGNAYPHKNLERLIRVFAEFRRKYPEFKLVLVGHEDYFYKRTEKFSRSINNGEGVIFPGYVPDQDLKSFYKEAKAYVFPSLYEGFGLPPLEAMTHDCVVVSSNLTCLPEILGESALYFDPYNEEEMLKQIKTAVSDIDLRNKLIGAGHEQIKKYSWDKCANEILSVYSAE